MPLLGLLLVYRWEMEQDMKKTLFSYFYFMEKFGKYCSFVTLEGAFNIYRGSRSSSMEAAMHRYRSII